MISRRNLLETAGATMALAGGHAVFPGLLAAEPAVPNLPAALPQGTRSEVVMDALPGKKPLIKLTYRPPNYETPLEYFRTPLTPNDAFFVRYHMADIPEVDAAKWRLTVGGDGANGEASLTLDDLKKMPAAEVAAVNQCSGNRRGLFEPHVPGIEWGYGAMGCARWKACGSRTFSTKSDSRRMRSKSCWTAPTDPSSTRRRSF
jgi:DMSO/TMAO reductase YedYZ molybdopterin-dependent catalytic subunit